MSIAIAVIETENQLKFIDRDLILRSNLHAF